MNKENMSKAEKRKQAFQHRKKESMKTLAIIVVVVVIAVVSIGAYYYISMDEENQNGKSSETVTPDDDKIRIPLSEISNSAEFYDYESSNGVTIRFFAVVGSDDNVHVALDACDSCFREKKGYRQEGDKMHCINCGLEYSILSIGTENTAGGCWPSYIPIELNGDSVIIKISDLEDKEYMF